MRRKSSLLYTLTFVMIIILTNSFVAGSSITRRLAPQIEGDKKLAQTATRIYNGEQKSGYLTGDNDLDYFYINVGANALSMEIVLNGPSEGDFDIYGRYDSYPDSVNYDWRGYEVGADEDVTHDYPESGTWYIMVISYWGSGTYYLTVTIDYSIPTTSSPTTPPVTIEPVLTPTLILGIGIVGAVVIVAVIIYVFMKRKPPSSEAEPFEVVYP